MEHNTQAIKVYFAPEQYDKLTRTIDATGDSISRIINTLVAEHLPDNYINELED